MEKPNARQNAIRLVPQPADLQMQNGFVKIKDAIVVLKLTKPQAIDE